jgi:hypothetical protein
MSTPSRVLGPALAIFQDFTAGTGDYTPATSRWPMVFAPEGLPLDRCVTFNCGIRAEYNPGSSPSSRCREPLKGAIVAYLNDELRTLNRFSA